jgi:cob(I)alamin adenosyltransferase
MPKIYTKTGDAGQTSLWGGTRLPKNHPRVAAYGDVDELNSQLGLALSTLERFPGFEPLTRQLLAIQTELFSLGAQLAAAPSKRRELSKTDAGKISQVESLKSAASRLEREIDAMTGELAPLKRFILPGGSPAGSLLHVARSVCRRAERAAVALSESEAVGPEILIYLNRLSDYLFTAARWANARANRAETTWEGLA